MLVQATAQIVNADIGTGGMSTLRSEFQPLVLPAKSAIKTSQSHTEDDTM